MDHDIPERSAFCPLFFARNGGQYSPEGWPIAGTIDEEGRPDALAIRSLCSTPYDCGTCPLLQEWVVAKQREGWRVSWECITCLGETERTDQRVLPGYYQSGRADAPPGDREYDPDKTCILRGCMRCGNQLSMIQLVMRKP